MIFCCTTDALEEQELSTLLEHLSPQRFSVDRAAQSFLFCVVIFIFAILLYVLLWTNDVYLPVDFLKLFVFRKCIREKKTDFPTLYKDRYDQYNLKYIHLFFQNVTTKYHIAFLTWLHKMYYYTSYINNHN
jgi:hypothetical protein